MAMEMRVVDNIATGEDLTPPLSPLAFVLRDSALRSHCSACFSTLPTPGLFLLVDSEDSIPTTHYCSSRCSSLDEDLHCSSAEDHLLSILRSSFSTWSDSTDLRLALRLLSIFEQFPETRRTNSPDNFIGGFEYLECYPWEVPSDLGRIGGLMTNRANLLLKVEDDSDRTMENVGERIKEGMKLMWRARNMRVNEYSKPHKHEEFVLEEAILCLVLTNAVEVHEKTGLSIGIAVYDTTFSWINHSCSPNSCYRFCLGPENCEVEAPLRLVSSGINDRSSKLSGSEWNCYGPRVVVRSIKAISKGDEVTIAYTDLLQPKEIRQGELWMKYRFLCSCDRCVAMPETYVDYALHALVIRTNKFQIKKPRDDSSELFIQRVDDTITDYLSSGDPTKCCNDLESLLSHGCFMDDKPEESLQLHPCHYLSLNAYIALASAKKIIANDLWALNPESRSHQIEALDMYKASSAYSLLLAGAVHSLYEKDSSLIVHCANFFINAGDSLLKLGVKSSLWGVPHQTDSNTSLSGYKCDECSLGDFEDEMNLERKRSPIYECIAKIISGIWCNFTCRCRFLECIQSPIDFSWVSLSESWRKKPLECVDYDFGRRLVLLSLHCLWYGSVLFSISNASSTVDNYVRLLNEHDY